MKTNMKKFLTLLVFLLSIQNLIAQPLLKINDKDYFDIQGLSIFAFTALYPEGHQGGIDIIQHGTRVATNGNLFLQPTPGQFQPVPKLLNKEVLKDEGKIVVTLQYPDSSRMTPNFNPMVYPDLKLVYDINIVAVDDHFKVTVDLEQPLPQEWVGKVGFNLELFPGDLFGKSYYMDEKPGSFPRFVNSDATKDKDGEFEALPMATGKKLTIVPENQYQTMAIESKASDLKLLDGRLKHNNGWFVVRSLVPANKTKNAIEWVIKPNIVKGWQYGPIVHTSQLGYHPLQEKIAIIELDRSEKKTRKAILERASEQGGFEKVMSIKPKKFDGDFLRYTYLKADFSDATKTGIYRVRYDDYISDVFRIDPDIYKKGVWQPVLEYFLPIQMCHMKVFEKYRVWHDHCHLDDALMAPANIDHFDGYNHKEIPKGYDAYQHIEGLDRGGWHDAGDYDLRVESQIQTVYYLGLAKEEFGIEYDQTTINQDKLVTEIHRPDGKEDALQQMEHGLLTVLGAYREFGQLYRGIICPTLRQYVMLGDAGSMTDNEVFDKDIEQDMDGLWFLKMTNKYSENFNPQMNYDMVEDHIEELDDRLVFLEENPGRALGTIPGLAISARTMRDYDAALAEECLKTAEALWEANKNAEGRWVQFSKVSALVELILTTDKEEYKEYLISMEAELKEAAPIVGWSLSRVLHKIGDQDFVDTMTETIIASKDDILGQIDNPFGVPYKPQVWGAGWAIQSFGYQYYFLHKKWPEIFTPEPIFNALNFVLGCHPGKNTASFATNVGTKSQTIAYGVNRGDFSSYPGGVVSGTNLIRPDFPELKDWPFMWQQGEYMIGGGSMPYMFLVLAVDDILSN
ncbi:MAG: glycoside hydrolase family 9 protein [Fidelibacterota bacterium]